MQTNSLINLIRDRFAAAVQTVAGQAVDPLVLPANPKFGDYECRVATSLARPLKAKPRDIAQRIIDAVELDDLAAALDIAGPGFINVRLRDEWLAGRMEQIGTERRGDEATEGWEADRLGLSTVAEPATVVIDYSSPNIAKQMHVGHLRSTVIGDVIARVLSFEGHRVVRQNHIGDWGTQFGMLIHYYRSHELPTDGSHEDVLAKIEDDYRAAQKLFKDDAEYATAARNAVTELQSGDAEARRLWELMRQASTAAFLDLYRRLGVLLDADDTCGESFYNDRLAGVVAELKETFAPGKSPRAELREDRGAECIFLSDGSGAPAFKNPDGDPLPMIVRKSDGGYNYDTTDLAAIRYRIEELGGRRLIYVTDARQKQHFDMLFHAARAAGWACDEVTLEHVTFGSVLDTNKRPLKTRTGENVLLRELLDEAEERALAVLLERDQGSDEVTERGRDEARASEDALAPEQQKAIARAVGVAAVKYFDLSRDRGSDYVFSWDNMLALRGNTAPYMMYAYARIRSIYRKAAERIGSPDVYGADVKLLLATEQERALGVRLARLRETLDAVADKLLPHILCTYLYELAQEFMRFYEACPVLDAPDDATRLSRLRLCDLTARTLKLGLGLLGIETIERM